jgi:ATP-dependent DNA helicase RecG
MEIEEILKQPESKVLEFKRDLSSLDPILKTIIAFANTAGGTLIIGRSSDGKSTGIKEVFRAEEALANSITDNIRPSILPDIEIATVEGKDLLVVKVPHWKAPFYLKREGVSNGVYVRLGSTSRRASPEILAELQRTILTPSFDQQGLSELTKDSLNKTNITRAFSSVGRKIHEEKLRSLGVLVPSAHQFVPSIGGLILFGKKKERQQFIPDAKVSCARFLGDSKTNILDRLDIEGTILDAVDEVPKFISRNTRLSSEIREIRRKDIPEYPPLAIREALINALVHADYSQEGSHIQIAIYNDRLEIQNPGMLPFGFTLEDLKAGVSKVRNRVLARVFHELKLMEQWGSGYKRMVEACEKGGYPEPKWEELSSAMRVTFYPHPISRTEKESQATHTPESERKDLILSFFKDGKSLPFREIYVRLAPLDISERMLRYDLAHLKKEGLLISEGKGRATQWKIWK